MIDLDRMRYEVAFWAQIAGDAKRTLICTPEDASRIEMLVADMDVGHIFAVRVSPACPTGQILIVDDPAFEGAHNETMQRMLRQWRFTT